MARASSRRRRRRWARGLTTTLVVVAIGVGGVIGVVRLLDSRPAPPVVERCAALADGTSWYLDPDQADNAALIALTAVRRGMPARAATIGLATALQESKLRNLDYGDRDSLGLFQQRPSQGWGTPEQVTDPVYATGAFYDALAKVDGYADLPVTEAAQAVQRSGFPDAYAQHEARSRAWASALTGYSPGSLTCTLAAVGSSPADPAGDADAVLARVARDLAAPAAATPADPATRRAATVTVQAAALPGGAEDPARLAHAVAQWAVALAGPLGLDEVRVADTAWHRTPGTWSPVAADAEQPPVPAGQVVLVLAAAPVG